MSWGFLHQQLVNRLGAHAVSVDTGAVARVFADHGYEDLAAVPAAMLRDIVAIHDWSAVYVCPTCRKQSPHPSDKRESYCGACHRWATDQASGFIWSRNPTTGALTQYDQWWDVHQ